MVLWAAPAPAPCVAPSRRELSRGRRLLLAGRRRSSSSSAPAPERLRGKECVMCPWAALPPRRGHRGSVRRVGAPPPAWRAASRRPRPVGQGASADPSKKHPSKKISPPIFSASLMLGEEQIREAE